MRYSPKTIVALRKSVQKWETICAFLLRNDNSTKAKRHAISLCDLCYDRLGMEEKRFMALASDGKTPMLFCDGCPLEPIDCCRDWDSTWHKLHDLDWIKYPDTATTLCRQMLSTLRKLLKKCEKETADYKKNDLFVDSTTHCVVI